MAVTKITKGRYRAQVHVKGKGNKHVGYYPTKREAEAAVHEARKTLHLRSDPTGPTVKEFAARWTTDPLFQRPKQSTNQVNAEKIKQFVRRYGDLPMRAVTDEVVAEYLAGGKRQHTVPGLRAMFGDARKPVAGRVTDENPFAQLGLRRSRGNKDLDVPGEDVIRRLVSVAGRVMEGGSLAAWLQVAAYTGMRPGELDALRWGSVDFERDEIRVVEQWSPHSRQIERPKNGKTRLAILTPPAREALLTLPRSGRVWVFQNPSGQHWTPTSRAYYWKAIRAAADYQGTAYQCGRHFAGWYMTNVLELPAEDVAIALGHEDGGTLVRTLYGHRDRRLARDRVREAYKRETGVTPLRAVDKEAG
jgi:integrase